MWLDFPYSELRKKEAKYYEICNVKRSKNIAHQFIILGLTFCGNKNEFIDYFTQITYSSSGQIEYYGTHSSSKVIFTNFKQKPYSSFAKSTKSPVM